MNSLSYTNWIYDIELKLISTSPINPYRTSTMIDTIESYDPIRWLSRFEAKSGYLDELGKLLKLMWVFYSTY